jgi:hypothetical protein
VVDLSRAAEVVVDAASVSSEARVRSVKGNGCGSVHKSSLEAVGRADGRDGAGDADSNLSLIVLAGGVIGHVGVALVEHQAELLHVGVAVGEEATVAAVVAVGPGAVDELLLSEDDLLAVLDGVVLLDGAGGRERPA